MSIQISTIGDISKIIAFIRGCAKGDFRVPPALVDEVLKQLRRYAKEKNVSIDFILPSGERVVVFTAYGATLGAAAGYIVANFPGALAGAALGSIAGYCAAHITIRMHPVCDGDTFTMEIL